jgi:hypothetical protein
VAAALAAEASCAAPSAPRLAALRRQRDAVEAALWRLDAGSALVELPGTPAREVEAEVVEEADEPAASPAPPRASPSSAPSPSPSAQPSAGAPPPSPSATGSPTAAPPSGTPGGAALRAGAAAGAPEDDFLMSASGAALVMLCIVGALAGVAWRRARG